MASPIEQMIDAACKRYPVKPPEEILLSVADAAEQWWLMHRPIAFSEAEHFESPAVNCVTKSEKELAIAVAEWLELTTT